LLVRWAEEERAEGGLEILVGRRASTPALDRAKDVTVPAQPQMLVVAAIAPVGVEHPLGAGRHAVAHQVADVDVGVVDAREERVPQGILTGLSRDHDRGV
jgi:hypothetical protein